MPKSKETAEESAESATDPLHEARERFAYAMDAWDADRKRYVEDNKFLEGEHWFEKDRKMREDQGRPCLVVDKLKQYVRQVVNDSRQNRPSIKVRPVDDEADIETADIIQGMCRHIEERSNADVAYDTGLECAVKGGFGFVRVLSEYAHDKTFDLELCIKRVRNPLTVLLDPDCQEPDGSDARFAFVFEEMPEDEFKAQWPDADLIDFGDEKYKYWRGEKTVTVAEYWSVKEEDKTVHLLHDGSVCSDEEYKKAEAEGLKPPPIKDTRNIPAKAVKFSRINGVEYLEGPITWPGKWIPVVPVWGNEVDIDGEVIHKSMIHDSKDAQRLYDFNRSAFAERVALTPKAPYVAAAGQVENYEDDWANANQANTSVLKYDPVDVAGHPVPPPQRQQAADIPAGFAQDMQMSEHDIQSTLGMYNASLGEKSNEKSGRAIMARQREGDVTNFHYHDNLARMIRHVGRIVVDLLPKTYDSTRIVRVLGLDGNSEMVQLDPTMETAKGKRDGKVVYNIGVGTYDVAVSSGPSYTTRRQEAAESMAQLTQGNPDIFPMIGDLMIRSMDWPMAEEIADRLKLMLPPQILEAEKKEEGGPPPEVAQIMQQAQQAIQQRDEVLQQVMAKLQEVTAEHKAMQGDMRAKMEELAIKARETEIKAYDAETKRAQVLAPAFDAQQIQALVVQTMQDLLSQQVKGIPSPVPGGVPEMPMEMDRSMENMPQAMPMGQG